MDFVSKEKRSAIMRGVKAKNTRPEMVTRSILHRAGYRFRVHRKDLPGKPDIVLPRFKAVIFVHGCFWHQHEDCAEGRMPSSNTAFWKKKFTSNRLRDRRAIKEIQELGWEVLVVWGCETAAAQKLEKRLKTFLDRLIRTP